MTKKAWLVYSTVGTRVVLPEDATWDEIYAKAHSQLIDNLNNGGADLCDDIFEDKDCPYNPELDGE